MSQPPLLEILVVSYADVDVARTHLTDIERGAQSAPGSYDAALMQHDHEGLEVVATTVNAREATILGAGLGALVGSLVSSPAVAGAVVGAGFGVRIGRLVGNLRDQGVTIFESRPAPRPAGTPPGAPPPIDFDALLTQVAFPEGHVHREVNDPALYGRGAPHYVMDEIHRLVDASAALLIVISGSQEIYGLLQDTLSRERRQAARQPAEYSSEQTVSLYSPDVSLLKRGLERGSENPAAQRDVCPECHEPNAPNRRFCARCGAPFATTT